MAHILEHSKYTLRQLLGRYHGLILGVAFLMSFGAMIFCLISIRSYSRSMGQVLCLNEYYVQLDQIDANLNQYISNSGAVQKELQDNMEKMQDMLEKLKKMKVNQNFQRDISDISSMMEQYGRIVEQIRENVSAVQGKWSSEIYGNILTLYDEAKDIYERINVEFKPLHLQLLTFTSLQQKTFMRRSLGYYGVFFLMMLILGSGGAFWGKKLSRWIVLPIQTLTNRAEEIRDGKLFEFQEIDVQKNFYREIEILTHAFNMMAQRIKAQIQIIEEDARTKASELKLLQMQMNPHFLFNTLNMIAKTAYMEDAGETVSLIQKTAQLLRYSLDYMGKSVTLASEIECLENYVYLQEQRFGKRIQFIFDLDERYHKVEIPCLILQPLVENSIIHGVGAFVEGGKIIIHTQYLPEKESVKIQICDNGVGMTEEELKRVEERLYSDEEQREKLGLANIYRRLHIFFGDRAEITIQSKCQVGTSVCIIIPVEKKERQIKYVADDYCG